MNKSIFDCIRVVTVDLDNTLWKTMPCITAANKALFDFFGGKYPNIMKRFPPDTWRGLQSKIMEDFPEDSHDLSKVRIRAIEYAARMCGERDPVTVSEEAFAAFIKK